METVVEQVVATSATAWLAPSKHRIFASAGPITAQQGGPSQAMIVDSHAIVREGLRRMLLDVPEVDVVAECDDGMTALEMFRDLRPDLVIMDMNLASFDGIDLISAIARRCKQTRVIVLSGAQSESQAAAAFGAGAHAYVLKHSRLSKLIEAVRSLRAGRHGYLDPQLNQDQLESLLRENKAAGATQTQTGKTGKRLTPRERQVLKLVAEGLRNRDIAECLSISMKTVETHRMSLMQKLDAHSTADLSRWAMRLGFLAA